MGRRVPSTIICKYFFFIPISLPLLIQRLTLNSWKGTKVVPVAHINQIPLGSWQQPSRPLGETHPVGTGLAAPCTLLGPFWPLPVAEQHEPPVGFSAAVSGEISFC